MEVEPDQYLVDFGEVADHAPDGRRQLLDEGRRREHARGLGGLGSLEDVDDLELVAARELGLADRVTLPGLKPDVRRYLAAMDVYLMSADFEGVPIALLEAMAMGLPIVATDVAGNRALIRDGDGGILCEFGKPAAIAKGLAHLIGDQQFYRRMSGASLARGQKYSLSRTADLHIDLYESLIARRQHSRDSSGLLLSKGLI